MSARSDSSPAPEELFEHADFLRALSRALLRDEQSAEDLVQDAYVVALQQPPRRGGSLRAFLGSIVRHLASNARRGDRRRVERERAVARPEPQESSALVVERLELQRAVLGLVLELREPYRTTLYRRYYEGQGPSAIARREGLPVKTVKTRLERGLAALRARLDQRSGGEREAWSAALFAVAWPQGVAGLALSGGALGGFVMAKKLVLVALFLALAWLGWRAFDARGLERGPEPGLLGPQLSAPVQEAPPEIVAVPRAAPTSPRAAERVSAAGLDPATGALVVELHWARDSKPAAFVELRAWSEEDPAPRQQAAWGRTDSAGRARFDGLHAGAVRLWLDRGPSLKATVVAGEERRVELEIPAGIDLEGRVVDAAGAPVAAAELWIGTRHGTWSVGSLAAQTGADGRFTLRSIEQETYVGARAAGHQPSMLALPGELAADGRGVRSLELVLGPPGGALEGVVLGPDGEPVEGALVHAGPRGGTTSGDSPFTTPRPVPVKTDERGRFALPGDLPSGIQPVHVMAYGHPLWAGEVEIEVGGRHSLEVQLELSGRVEGRVLDARGAPVAGARVVQAEEVGGGWYFHAFPPPQAESDEEGRFALDWLPSGPQELNASTWSRPELGKARVRVVVAAGETTDCELVLSLGATIEGRVVDAEGNGLAGWGIRARPTRFGQIYPRSAKSDADGRFVVANLGDSPFDLEVRAPGEWSIQPRAAARGVAPGERGVQLVVLDTQASSARLVARLEDARGAAPSDVQLTLWPADGRAGEFLSCDPSSGRVEHGPCPADDYVLKIERGGRAVLSVGPFELRDGETTDLGVLRIGALGAARVSVVGVPPDELDQLELSLGREHESSLDMELDGGVFSAADLSPGTWIIHVRSDRHWVPDAELEITGGETAELQLSARSARELQLGLRVEGSDDWTQVSIEVRDEAGSLVSSPWPQARSNVTARGVFPGGLRLPDGAYRVEAWTDGGQRADAMLIVDEGTPGAAPLELVLR